MKKQVLGTLICTIILGSTCVSAMAEDDVIIINYPTYRVGADKSSDLEQKMIEEFNELYEGKYKVVIEEVPSDSAYADKMKVLAASNELPPVIDGKSGVRELAIANGQAQDLTELINADEEYKSEIGEAAIAANTIDGKLYSISINNVVMDYYYNTEIFEAAGIEPAKTWDEFMENLQKIKDAGYTPITMMTGENCWTTNVLLAAMIGTAGEAGNQFMNTKYPETYQIPEVIESLGRIQKILQEYTTPDAIGATYSVAANHFLNGEVGILCNGTWVIPDFSNEELAVPGLADKISSSVYPENGSFAQYEVGLVLCTDDPKLKEAAWEFMKYKTNAEAQARLLEEINAVPLTSQVEIPEELKENQPLLAKIIEECSKADYGFKTFSNTAYPSVVDEMVNIYPGLASGEITPEEFAAYMDEAAAQNVQ